MQRLLYLNKFFILIRVAAGGGIITGNRGLFMQYMISSGIILSFIFIGSYAIYKLTDFITPMRVDESEESQGLDISQHDESYLIQQSSITGL